MIWTAPLTFYLKFLQGKTRYSTGDADQNVISIGTIWDQKRIQGSRAIELQSSLSMVFGAEPDDKIWDETVFTKNSVFQ